MISSQRDHGGGIDAAILTYGGHRRDWLDLSTGINPEPYPLPQFCADDWTALPDQSAHQKLCVAARRFWSVPERAGILPAPGASALIARLPALDAPGQVCITMPTYNEHAAAFRAQGWVVTDGGPAQARVLVHPNNPDGQLWQSQDADAPLTIIDESFCDVAPAASLVHLASRPGCVVLKSFGKFWGLAGLRLGFAIAAPDVIDRLAALLGPWAVSGPALRLGAMALSDEGWADTTRARLARDARRLDQAMIARGAHLCGGTDLFRLYDVPDAAAWQHRLAQKHIGTRIFPYSKRYLRLGLPPARGWGRLLDAL
ncbi:pyridoxal phosphate-dependent class II aminotransferase [Rhodobacteraceae bacterium F11138]|nr:pyridoxal phosphate-dependent class II aminotransferase [Rhodobacteraceae bacterium F11138]